MDFIDQIKAISQQIEKLKDQIQNEQATKSAFIMPFIQALGYNVFNPMEVAPEYTADLPGLKNDKVDYAIVDNGQPIIFIECKCCGESLESLKHSAQLRKYFHNTEAKFGILTNGILYRFYTDIEKSHIMDEKPFFEFNMLNFIDSDINELKRFSKSSFDPDELGDVAQNLLYTKEMKRLIALQLEDPSPEFVKFFSKQIYSGIMTASVVEKFSEITKRSLKEFINERITGRLKTAIDLPENTTTSESANEDSNVSDIKININIPENGIVTTEDELEGFYIIKSILREVVDVGRIQYKDTKNYFGINVDGKVTKTICRLYFTPNKKVVSIPDANRKEAKQTISNLDEIYGMSKILKDKVLYLTQGKYIEEVNKTEQT